MNPTEIDTSSAVEAIQQTAEQLASMDASGRVTFIWDALRGFAPKLVTAVVLYIIGMLVIRATMKFTRKCLQRSKLDPTLHSFILSIFRAVLYILLAIIVLNVLFPNVATSLVAMLGIFGLAISLAVKDSLSNLAAGFSVLFTRPFALGDYVVIGSNEGTVQEIRLNYTVLKTVDNKLIHIPNSDVTKAQITNFTGEPLRRLDQKYSIGYNDDFDKAKGIILEILASHPMALSEPEPLVRVCEHGASAIVIVSRVWCKTEDYWTLNFDLLEEVKRRFDAAGISIPFNQLDVHIN